MDSGREIDLSLNEVEITTAKAARGAGHVWGAAEDIGRSARWLARHGVEWAGALLAALGDPRRLEPERSGPVAGLALADALPLLPPGAGLQRRELSQAAWALPPIAAVAARRGLVLTGWLGPCPIRLAAGVLQAPVEDWTEVAGDPAARHDLVLAPDPTPPAPPDLTLPELPLSRRSRLTAAQLAALEALVWRTYVPNSEKSRLRGAGARPTRNPV